MATLPTRTCCAVTGTSISYLYQEASKETQQTSSSSAQTFLSKAYPNCMQPLTDLQPNEWTGGWRKEAKSEEIITCVVLDD